MNQKQKRFVAEYIKDVNGTQAAIRAGYSKKTANEQASRLLAKANIRAAVEAGQKKYMDKLEVTTERILSELSLMGFANMLDYIRTQKDGSAYVDFSKLSREQAAAMQEITVEEYTDGGGDDARPVKRTRFKLGDKRGSLELLGKYLKMFTDKVEHTVSTDPLAELLAEFKIEHEKSAVSVDPSS